MSEAIDSGDGTAGSWSVLARGEWGGSDELLVELTDAVRDLPVDDDGVLYDYVAVDAMLDALALNSESRGVSELRFEYDCYEIKVTREGVIAVAPDPSDHPGRP